MTSRAIREFFVGDYALALANDDLDHGGQLGLRDQVACAADDDLVDRPHQVGPIRADQPAR